MLLTDENKIHFALGIHNHQPIGNWDRVIEDAYQHSYLPFIDVLERHKGVRVTIHYAGHLLTWLAEHHPEFLERLRAMIGAGQIELLTGGFYEPILTTIPDEDKVGQIRRLTETVRKLTGFEAEGMWLAGRVWEPHLAKPIAEAGVRYAILDDAAFRTAGLSEEERFGYYQTEEQGEVLSLFPDRSTLRALLPFEAPEKIIEHLRGHATGAGNRLALCFQDGEKFGGWPNTYQRIYIEGWLDRFFGLLEEHADWITTSTISDYRARFKPWGRIYLPAASDRDMQAWALPPEQALRLEAAREEVPAKYQDFLAGGYWRHFLIKYPEANNLHKKMLRVAGQIKAASRVAHAVPAGSELAEPVESTIAAARDALWRGQSNDPYWHGVFGGIYLNHLRTANYAALIEAEVACDRVRHGDAPFCELEVTDFDRNGGVEALVSTREQNLYFTPSYGGALFEHDMKASRANLLDTLARRPEAYHRMIARGGKEGGLERFLQYDWYRRLSLLDHFLHPDSRLETFQNMSYGEQGDFINQSYDLATRETEAGVVICLQRDGHVWVGPEFWPIRVAKEVLVPRDGSGFTASYTVTNLWDRPLDLWFGVEFNFNLRSTNSHESAYYTPSGRHLGPSHLASTSQEERLREIGLRDEALGLDVLLSFSELADLWRFPVETVSRSESGFERVYQSSVLFPHWRLALAPSGSWSCRMDQRITTL